MKIKNAAIAWFRRNADSISYGSPTQIIGEYMGRRIRITYYCPDHWKEDATYIGDLMGKTHMDVGDECFDRWANSTAVEYNFDLSKPIQPQIAMAVKFAKDHPDAAYHKMSEDIPVSASEKAVNMFTAMIEQGVIDLEVYVPQPIGLGV